MNSFIIYIYLYQYVIKIKIYSSSLFLYEKHFKIIFHPNHAIEFPCKLTFSHIFLQMVLCINRIMWFLDRLLVFNAQISINLLNALNTIVVKYLQSFHLLFKSINYSIRTKLPCLIVEHQPSNHSFVTTD